MSVHGGFFDLLIHLLSWVNIKILNSYKWRHAPQSYFGHNQCHARASITGSWLSPSWSYQVESYGRLYAWCGTKSYHINNFNQSTSVIFKWWRDRISWLVTGPSLCWWYLKGSEYNEKNRTLRKGTSKGNVSSKGASKKRLSKSWESEEKKIKEQAKEGDKSLFFFMLFCFNIVISWTIKSNDSFLFKNYFFYHLYWIYVANWLKIISYWYSLTNENSI